MNTNWLLRSSTLYGAVGLSVALSMAALLFSQDGLPELRRRQAELDHAHTRLMDINRRNHALLEEVQRLAAKDPELMEALARRQGYARPGETIYTFRNRK